MKIDQYFKDLERKVKVNYAVAEEARKRGLDPRSKVEVPRSLHRGIHCRRDRWKRPCSHSTRRR